MSADAGECGSLAAEVAALRAGIAALLHDVRDMVEHSYASCRYDLHEIESRIEALLQGDLQRQPDEDAGT